MFVFQTVGHRLIHVHPRGVLGVGRGTCRVGVGVEGDGIGGKVLGTKLTGQGGISALGPLGVI